MRGEAALVFGLGLGVVVVPGLDNGGYQSSAWTWYTLALASVAAIRALGAGLPGLAWPERLMLLALAGLAGWMWLSGAWDVPGSEPGLEARRSVLYLTTLLAFVTCVRARTSRALAGGILLGISVVSAYALLDRSTTPNAELEIPFQGVRLVGSVGYANALGVLAAMGIVLAVGLASIASHGKLAACLRAAIVVLAVALTLTESAGGVLALGVGLAGLVVLVRAPARWDILATLAATALPAGLACIVATRVTELALLLVLLVASLAAASAPFFVRERRLAVVVLVVASIAGAVGAVLAAPTDVSLGVRADYWRVALDDFVARPLLGSGAGSFRVRWLEERPVAENARDAHSLYLETLGELGLVGLVLVAAVILTPLVVGVRRRSDPLAVTAACAFLVYAAHAALDWDWEMPVVTMTALGCGAAALARGRPDRGASTVERAVVLAAALALAGLALVLLASGAE